MVRRAALSASLAVAVSVAAAVVIMPAALGVASLAGASLASAATAVSHRPVPLRGPVLERPSRPIWAEDAPDPDVVRFGSTYYAYTTGAVWGFHIGVLKSKSPLSGWHAAVSGPQGSSALPRPPAWESSQTQTSPAVVKDGATYVMFYDAESASVPSLYCLSRATAASPAGPFTDTSKTFFGPCSTSYRGSIDPEVVNGPHSTLDLVWKENDSGPYGSAQIFSQQLSSDAATLVGTRHLLLTQDSGTYHWETTAEDPALTKAGGTWWLVFAAGLWTNSSYSEAFVKCAGPLGPCGNAPSQILTSYGSVHGPGGGSVVGAPNGEFYLAFAAWTAPCTHSGGACGRELYMTPIEFSALAVQSTSSGHGMVGHRYRRRLVASGGIGPETWSATGLPAGLRVDADTGVISGRAKSAGTSRVAVAVSTSGAHPEHASATVTITIQS